MTETLLQVDQLVVNTGAISLVDGLSFTLAAGEILALVGESGCGKSMTALSLMNLLPAGVKLSAGNIVLKGQSLPGLSESAMQAVRGNEISMIFQEPSASLNPLMSIGDQIIEAIRAHRPLSVRDARQQALRLLEAVGIAAAETRLKQFAFELSGGMCQRVMIATALACQPAVLIADEPTTALDVTIQAQILALIKQLRDDTGTAVILITHDIGVVADMADRVAVMYAGCIVEIGNVFDIFAQPRHPYTHLLLNSVPRLDDAHKQRLRVIDGVVPEPQHWSLGCRFHKRCPLADAQCQQHSPPLQYTDEHGSACWHSERLDELT